MCSLKHEYASTCARLFGQQETNVTKRRNMIYSPPSSSESDIGASCIVSGAITLYLSSAAADVTVTSVMCRRISTTEILNDGDVAETLSDRQCRQSILNTAHCRVTTQLSLSLLHMTCDFWLCRQTCMFDTKLCDHIKWCLHDHFIKKVLCVALQNAFKYWTGYMLDMFP